ncbi:hypothetical protein BW247_12620 [Acidihalobacter ferrooxydans]|uniref:Uncharacterized protein n=2 Tax=Acidihalobacter ferrooxydans TaxID=1765967 RepID=A0A1P8UJ19_9GAMM|nr:hypothetical protein BW247_12620 [Acidihalobacter ferrooxydans]
MDGFVMAFHVFGAVIGLAVVFAALMPDKARNLLDSVGLRTYFERLGAQRLLRISGKFLLALAAGMALSAWTGHLSKGWFIPAAQIAFFGLILWFIARRVKKVD